MGGLILARTSAHAVPLMISASLAICLLVVFLLAPRLGRPRRASPLSAEELQQAPKLLNRYFVLFVAGTGLINGSHGFMYGFASIYWKAIGLGDSMIGFLWAFAVISEALVFLLFTRLFGHMRATTLVMVSGIAAIVRWIAYPLVWPAGFGISGFVVVQGMHSLSTALLLIALQKMIAETVPEERTGAAQGAGYFAIGISMATVTLVSGPLYARFGADGFLAMTAVAALGTVLVALSARFSPRAPVPAATPATRGR